MVSKQGGSGSSDDVGDFGHQIERYIAEHGPVSAADIVDGVGCSRQRVYTWLQRNRPRLRANGMGAHGAKTYTLRAELASVVGGGAGVNGESSTERIPLSQGVSIGDTLLIAGMRWVRGELVIALEAEDGTELVARVQ